MDKIQAEQLAVQALSWMANDDEIIGGFLGVTGASVDDLRIRAADPEFLGFVLDYLLSSDEMVEAFSRDAACPPDQPMRARAVLPGGDIPNWT